MGMRISQICVDAHDPHRLAAWWAEALGWELGPVDDDAEAALEPPEGAAERGVVPGLYFQPVAEGKTAKNRLHLDLRPDDQASEVARLEGMGARRVDVGQRPDVSWVVLADPEGNEFCVLRALAPGETG